jgi:hypothetical protein
VDVWRWLGLKGIKQGSHARLDGFRALVAGLVEGAAFFRLETGIPEMVENLVRISQVGGPTLYTD